MVAERQPPQQPGAHRHRVPRDLVQELRVEPPLDQAPPVEPRLQVVPGPVQPGGGHLVRAEAGQPLHRPGPGRVVQGVRVGVDEQGADGRGVLRRAVPLGQVEPESLQDPQPGLPEPDHQRRAERAGAGHLRRGRGEHRRGGVDRRRQRGVRPAGDERGRVVGPVGRP